MNGFRRALLGAIGLVLSSVLVAGLPAFADSVTVIGGPDTTVGLDGRQSISPPADGFTDVSVQSSNTGVATVEQSNSNAGGQGFDFKTTGKGVVIVTVTWTNPKTKEVKKQYYAIAVGVKAVVHKAVRKDYVGNQVAYVGITDPTHFSATSDSNVIGLAKKGDENILKATGEGTVVIAIPDAAENGFSIYTYEITKKPADKPEPKEHEGDKGGGY